MRGKRITDNRIELGLAVSALSLRYGETRSTRELARFCNCAHVTIQNIERKALQKARVIFAKLQVANGETTTLH